MSRKRRHRRTRPQQSKRFRRVKFTYGPANKRITKWLRIAR